MLRFNAHGDKGPLLGLGLSLANLERLEADDPIVFDLLEQRGLGSLVIAAEGTADETVDEAHGIFDLGHRETLRLSSGDIDALRSGEVLLRPLSADTGLTTALLFAGDDELTMLQSLQASGLLPDGAELLGLEEYALHEANVGPGCPACEERDGAPSQYGAAGRREGPRPTLGQRLLARPNLLIAICVGLLLAVAGVITVFVELNKAAERRERDAKRQRRLHAAQKQATADKHRRELLAKGDSAILAPKLGVEVCPQTPRKPPQLRRRMIYSLNLLTKADKREGLSRFESKTRWLVAGETLDVMPASPSGVGPIRQRLHRDSYIDKRRRPISPPLMRTFVITRWRDPILPKDIKKTVREAPEGTTRKFVPGLVAGRLLLYSYAERRFICASPEVEARTPELTLVRTDDFIKPGRKLIDAPLTKARVETMLAAMRLATRNLRLIRR